MTNLPDIMPSLLDREIESTHDDAFGHRHYAKALEGLIESPNNIPPYSIGLLGKWGSGKSSIKTLYLRSLQDGRIKRYERVHTITFNAWRFGGEDIKRALLKHVFCEIGGNKNDIVDALYARIQKTVIVPKKWREIIWEIYDKWPWVLVQVISVILILFGSWYALQLLDVSNDWVKGAIASILAWIFNPTRFIVSRYTNFLRVQEPTTAAEQYEDLLLAQLKNFKRRTGKLCERLVIFVDDLDRLSADEMVAGLDAIRTFMEMPNIPDGLGVVFVISCDEERIATALGRRNREAETPATVITRNDARRFLDRIFQFRLEIPPFPARDMTDYAKKKLRDNAPKILEDLENSGHNIDDIVGRMIHQGVRSPRNALQILNAFLQCWWVARKREQDGAGSDRTGGLAEGAVTKHPSSLAAICALRVDFPDFYSDLENEPDLISRFTEVFILRKSIDEQPEAIRDILRKYHDDNSKLKSSYYGLRQYLSSLRGLKWPPSIQPLLLLSQDPILRKFGDNARRVYDAFVSGDVQGMLVSLGRDADANMLGSAETSLLVEMERDLYREPNLKRCNAYSALISLSSRLSEPALRQLLAPVSRVLVQSSELRQLVGVAGTETCVRFCEQDERRLIAGQLIKDLLKTEGEIEFSLPSGELPSLDEAISMVRSACDLVLTIRDQDGLEQSDEQQLLAWLLTRRVGIGGKEQMLSLNELDRWVEQYENSLLPSLREGYSESILDALRGEANSDVDIDAALGRCRKVFDILWDMGEDSRHKMFDQLIWCIALKHSGAVTLAHEVMQIHLSSADKSMISNYIVNFADRLYKDAEEDGWDLEDRENHYNAFLTQLSDRKEIVDGKLAGPDLRALAIAWGADEQTGEYAARLMDMLTTIDRESAGEVISNWTENTFADLAEQCVNWLSVNFLNKLNQEERNTVIATMTQAVENEAIREEDGERYQGFLKSIPNEALSSSELQEHLRQLLSYIQSRYGNNDYLHRVYPIIPRVIASCPKAELGNMLQGLFDNTQSNIDLFAWLHSQMTGHWPKKTPETGAYNPDSLLGTTSNVLSQYPQHPTAPNILSSMVDLAKRDIVGADQKAVIVKSACTVWPKYQDSTISALEVLSSVPSLEDTIHLNTSLDLNNEDHIASLTKAWQLICPLLTSEDCIDGTRKLLAENQRGNAQEPDLCLRLWLHSSSDYESIMRGLIADEALNDEQRKRLWLQAIRDAEQLEQAFFVEILPGVLSLPDSEETAKAILDHEQQVSALFNKSKDESYKLGKTLLYCLPLVSLTSKNSIAAWIHRLKVPGVLKELSNSNLFTGEDVEALTSVFGNISYLKKLSKLD